MPDPSVGALFRALRRPLSAHQKTAAPEDRDSARLNQCVSRPISNMPGRIRTCNLRLRRPTIYPIDLRAQLSGQDCIPGSGNCQQVWCDLTVGSSIGAGRQVLRGRKPHSMVGHSYCRERAAAFFSAVCQASISQSFHLLSTGCRSRDGTRWRKCLRCSAESG